MPDMDPTERRGWRRRLCIARCDPCAPAIRTGREDQKIREDGLLLAVMQFDACSLPQARLGTAAGKESQSKNS